MPHTQGTLALNVDQILSTENRVSIGLIVVNVESTMLFQEMDKFRKVDGGFYDSFLPAP